MTQRLMIDLFSGAGGLSCGLEMAGFHPILANEMVHQYAATYQKNHSNTHVIVGDIRNISNDEILSQIPENYEIDLVAGGPPCQGFSVNAPIRSLDDPRNHLFKEFLRVVELVRPKAVLIENVPGIISLGKGTVIERIYLFFKKLGYYLNHRILFAGHYGVPQMRFRTIIIGLKANNVKFPLPEYYSTAVANFSGSKELCYNLTPIDKLSLKPQTTVWNAIGDLPEIDAGNRNGDFQYNLSPQSVFQNYVRIGSTGITSHFCAKLSKINLERLSYIPQGGSWRDIPTDLLPNGLKRARRSDHTKRYGRLSPDDLCSTIMTKCDPHWGSFFHPYQARALSVREAARIQSFPDRYCFTGNMTEQYEQVGNAVPPLLARAVGNSITQSLQEVGL